MGLKRLLVPVVALLVVAGLVLGLVSGVFALLAHQGLEAAGLETPTAPSTPADRCARPAAPPDPAASGTDARQPAGASAPASPDPSSSVPLPAPVLAGTEGGARSPPPRSPTGSAG